MVIIAIRGRQILDSRGKPTVEVDVMTSVGIFRASVPSGVSSSQIFEALELRDGGYDFQGKGVKLALCSVNKFIARDVVRKRLDARNQSLVDSFLISLDGTDDKSRRGVNAIAPVSMAVCRAGAVEKGIPLYQHISGLIGSKDLILPVPAFNMINGGIHAHNLLAMQEFLIIPIGAKTFSEAMKMGVEVYHYLKEIIQMRYGFDSIGVGDQGGFSPQINTADEALDLLVVAIGKAGYTGRIKLGIDVAASEFYREGKYDLNYKCRKTIVKRLLTAKELHSIYMSLIKKYPIIVIEDPFDFADWRSSAELTAESGIAILGDDLTVTNIKKIQGALKRQSCNGILIKLNQVGTVMEVIHACQAAQGGNWKIMVSHRSGETEDSFIADLAVGVRAQYIKAGAPCRSERVSKYNQLLRIEEELGVMASYAGSEQVESTDV